MDDFFVEFKFWDLNCRIFEIFKRILQVLVDFG